MISLIRWVFFPWQFWRFAGIVPKWLVKKKLMHAGPANLLWGMLYIGIFLPLSLFLLVEILIFIHDTAHGEHADYRILRDEFTEMEKADFSDFGPPTPAIPIVDPSKAGREAYHWYLVQKHAPVLFQKVLRHPEWDIPTFLDFDGNLNPRDNIENERTLRPLKAGVYGEVSAETDDSYYLTYTVYHVKDYAHPILDSISPSASHDNDTEGLHIRVDKRTMEVAEIETWFHNVFLLYNRTGKAKGTQPIQGPIYLEGGSHPLVYGPPHGHGVRLVQAKDISDLKRKVKVFRYAAGRKEIPMQYNSRYQNDVTYRLSDYDSWYERAMGPIGEAGDKKGASLFVERLPIGKNPQGNEVSIGRYIASVNFDIDAWALPKPPWSWDDGWDDVPIATLHFLPSYAFQKRTGENFSHKYLYNRPLDKIFGMSVEEMLPWLELEKGRRNVDKLKMQKLRERRNMRLSYWGMLLKSIKSFVNRVSFLGV